MKKEKLINMLLLGGAVQCDIGIESLYITTDRIDDSEVYLYIKRSDALEKPFFGLQASILEYLQDKKYLVVLLDGMNKVAYVLEQEDIKNIIASRNPNKSGAYLINVKDLSNGIDEGELVRFLAEEVKILKFLDDYTISTTPLLDK